MGNRIDSIVPISEAKIHLSELVAKAGAGSEAVLLKHGKPAAVVVGAEQYQAMLDELEDLRDRLSVHEVSGAAVPLQDIDESDLVEA